MWRNGVWCICFDVGLIKPVLAFLIGGPSPISSWPCTLALHPPQQLLPGCSGPVAGIHAEWLCGFVCFLKKWCVTLFRIQIAGKSTKAPWYHSSQQLSVQTCSCKPLKVSSPGLSLCLSISRLSGLPSRGEPAPWQPRAPCSEHTPMIYSRSPQQQIRLNSGIYSFCPGSWSSLFLKAA